MGNPAMPQSCDEQEPVIYTQDVDMTQTGERNLVPAGTAVYGLFFASFAAGTTLFEVNINGRWSRVQEGDTIDFGDRPTKLPGVIVRTQPALAGLFSQVEISGTSDTLHLRS